MRDKRLKELESLADSVVSGERVILFAPGLWSVVATIFLLLCSTILLSTSLISIYGSEIELSHKAIYQLIGLIFIFLFVILPGLMLFRGHKGFRNINSIYSFSLVLISITNIIWAGSNGHLIPLLISLGAASLGFFLINSPAYKLCSEFYFLLKVKRKNSNPGKL